MTVSTQCNHYSTRPIPTATSEAVKLKPEESWEVTVAILVLYSCIPVTISSATVALTTPPSTCEQKTRALQLLEASQLVESLSQT